MEPNSKPGDSKPDEPRSGDLLESSHTFPCRYKLKAIGQASADFEARVLSVARAQLGANSDLEHSVRATPGGRHVAITLEATVQTADQVRELYAALHQVEGLTLLI